MSKSVPFRLDEDIHAKFKGYCAIKKTTMQSYLHQIVELTIEKNASPDTIYQAIKNIDEEG